MAEGKKEKIGKRAANILTESSGDTKDSSQILSRIDDTPDTKGNKPMAEQTIGKQDAKWPEMMMGMWNNIPSFTSSNKAMEPFTLLMKMPQHGMNIYQSWVDQSGKIGEASRSGDVKKVWETFVESNREIINTCQEAMKEHATACNELFRTFIPALSNFSGTRR